EAAGRQVAAAARSDASERVRYEAVQLLGRWKGSLSFAAADLEVVAANDNEQAIRGAAAAALAK
ncbi:MAG TPA: hypothetical protein VK509_23175, partial [Polyangiales bacterium]|nr:hypothetical protein [Polyangiales bacterium]